jgi:hypothetical protein
MTDNLTHQGKSPDAQWVRTIQSDVFPQILGKSIEVLRRKKKISVAPVS